MKLRSLGLGMGILFLAGFQASAEECRLATAIPFSGNPQQEHLSLPKAVFNEVPQFVDSDLYVPGKSSLTAGIFPVRINGVKSSFVGAQIWIDGVLESVGISNGYSGNIDIQGSESIVNGERVLTSRSSTFHDGRLEEGLPRHVRGYAVTESRVTFKNGAVTSMMLTIPVYTVWRRGEIGVLTAFTGRHQKLCLVRAM